MPELNANLRKFIMSHFSDAELGTLSFDYFPKILEEFSVGMQKSQKVQMLISYCQRRGWLTNLYEALKKERPQPYQEQLDLPTLFPTASTPASDFVHIDSDVYPLHDYTVWDISKSNLSGRGFTSRMREGAEGTFESSDNHTLTIKRANTLGSFSLELGSYWQKGKKTLSIKHDGRIYRTFSISCDVEVKAGKPSLIFVFYEVYEDSKKWLVDKRKHVYHFPRSKYFEEEIMIKPPTKDFLFRIDAIEHSQQPSIINIRNLIVREVVRE